MQTPDGILSPFLKDMKKYPLLDRAQESKLAQQYEESKAIIEAFKASGGTQAPAEVVEAMAAKEEAWVKLVNSNIRLVISIARKMVWKNPSRQMPDAIQDGMVGLMKGIEKFDYRRGFKLSTYASWWIRQSIQREGQLDALVHIPLYMQDNRLSMKHMVREFKRKNQRAPTDSEIESVLNWKPGRAQQVLSFHYQILSMDRPVSGEDDDLILGDYIEDELAVIPEESCVEADRIKFLEAACHEVLGPREIYILVKRYDLDGQGEHSLDQIGQLLDEPVTRERVRQIQSKAEQELRKRLLKSDVL